MVDHMGKEVLLIISNATSARESNVPSMCSLLKTGSESETSLNEGAFSFGTACGKEGGEGRCGGGPLEVEKWVQTRTGVGAQSKDDLKRERLVNAASDIFISRDGSTSELESLSLQRSSHLNRVFARHASLSPNGAGGV